MMSDHNNQSVFDLADMQYAELVDRAAKEDFNQLGRYLSVALLKGLIFLSGQLHALIKSESKI